MSAIAGIVQWNNGPLFSMQYGTVMMEALRKYPADDVQVWHGGHAFLGCHAQWITPESVGEPLPYYDAERRLAITADAIIDNRKELIEKIGIQYIYGNELSDSRLILLAYAKWGEETPKYLVGDFAFMIWDEREHKLFGARDFSGSRLLYYRCADEHFAFSTVMEPLLTLPSVRRTLNEQWIAEFLAIPFAVDAVDVSATVYEQIKQVPPSHSITVRETGIVFQQYCTLNTGSRLRLKSNEEYEEALREVLGEAVKARLRTHRKVGAHLSGGLDSGSVASIAAKALRDMNKPLYTYSYVPVDEFTDWTHRSRVANEKPHIRATVEHVGNIVDHYLSFEENNSYSDIDDWLDVLEMPYKFYENSYWLNGIYREAEREGIGVLLNGQRGNWTISWGFALDYQALLLRRFRWYRLQKEMRSYCEKVGAVRRKVLKSVAYKAFPALTNMLVPVNEDYNPQMINPRFAAKMKVLERIAKERINIVGKHESSYAVKKNQFEKLYYWNLNGVIGTKMSLRHRLWERDPTNDLRVVRFCLTVPEEQYVQDGVARSLIRRATRQDLPEQVRMNLRVKGIQGADGVHRMTPMWPAFYHEAEQLMRDPAISEYVDMERLKLALSRIREPKPELVFEMDFRIVMRSLIFARFLKRAGQTQK